MFTPPSVNQIASAYKGNPAPLNQKVDTDRKQNGGIPRDLRQLMAAYDLSQGRQNMGIQQALQIPTNMPTVAQDVQERARQALQARQMQQAQEMQRKNGMPNMVPPGTPRPPMQAQGLDMLESNVGEEYAHGGIIGDVEHFDGKTGSKVRDPNEATSPLGDFFRSITEGYENLTERQKLRQQINQNRPGLTEALTPAQREERKKTSQELVGQLGQLIDNGEITTPYPQGGKPIPGNWDRPTGADDTAREVGTMLRQTPDALKAEAQAPAVAPTKKINPNAQAAQTQTRVNTDSAPMPAGLKDLAGIPSMGAARSYERDRLREDPAKAMADIEAEYNKKVGQRDLSIYDQMAEQLKARKERLNAPKAGYDATMELLEQIAAGGGRNWMEAGSRGVAGQRALQKDRLSQQDLLMEKILDLGAKKSDALFAEKKGMFDLTQGEKNRIIKDKQEIAKSLGLSEDKERELIQQALENELNRKNQIRAAQIGAQDRDNLMSRAKALMAANPKLTLEQAMQRAGELGAAGQIESADVKRLAAYKASKAKLAEQFPEWSMRDTPEGRKVRARYEQQLAQARIDAGLSPAGLNALPGAAASGTVPPVGTVMEGYRFKGGNPRDQNNWEKV